jgi:hypothetical protein
MCGAIALACVAGAQRPEPNAFLNRPAHSVTSLINQVKNDPEVFSRLSRHYGMNREELIAYLSTFREAKLTRTGLYTVYNVREDEIIRSRLLTLHKGSMVFVDPLGEPVMKKVCGNPLTLGPRNLSATMLVPEAPTTMPAEAKVLTEVMPVPETPVEMMVVEEVVAPPFVPEVAPPITPTPPTITPPTETPVVKPSFESGPVGWLLPLLAGSVVAGGGGGGNGVIPEPATIGAMASLIGLYGLSRKRAKSKKQ